MITALLDLLTEFVTRTIGFNGYWGILLLMTLESACIPIPSEIIMPFSGFLVSAGQLTLIGVTIVGAFANLLGSLVTYAIGYFGGRPFLIRYGRYVLIREKEMEHADRFFDRYGDFAVFIARNLPIVRTFISLPAGVARMNFPKFAIYSFIGSIPWCLALAYGGFLLRNNWAIVREYSHWLDIAVVITAIVWLLMKWKKSKEGVA